MANYLNPAETEEKLLKVGYVYIDTVVMGRGGGGGGGLLPLTASMVC